MILNKTNCNMGTSPELDFICRRMSRSRSPEVEMVLLVQYRRLS